MMEIDSEDDSNVTVFETAREETAGEWSLLQINPAVEDSEFMQEAHQVPSTRQEGSNMMSVSEEVQAVVETGFDRTSEDSVRKDDVYSKEDDMSCDTTNASCTANVTIKTENDTDNHGGDVLPENDINRKSTETPSATNNTEGDTGTEIARNEQHASLEMGTVDASKANALPNLQEKEAVEEISKSAALEAAGQMENKRILRRGKVQSHCYLCGCSRISLQLYKKLKGGPLWYRHRCLAVGCGKTTGHYYIGASDDNYVVYRQDLKDYPFRNMLEELPSNSATTELESEGSGKEEAAAREEDIYNSGQERQGIGTCQADEINPCEVSDSQDSSTSVKNESQSCLISTDIGVICSSNVRNAKMSTSGLDMDDSDTPDPKKQNMLGTVDGDKMGVSSASSRDICKGKSSGRRHTVRKQPGHVPPRRQVGSAKQKRSSPIDINPMYGGSTAALNPVDGVVSMMHEVAVNKSKMVKKNTSSSANARRRKVVFEKKSKLVNLKHLKGRKGATSTHTTVMQSVTMTANLVEQQQQQQQQQPKRKTRSWGTQTYTYEVIEAPTTSHASVSAQTELDKVGVVDLLLDEWTKGDVEVISIKDRQSLLRRIKVAQTILYLQNKELRMLREERRAFKQIQEKAKCAVSEMKKEYATQLSRVREGISVMTKEFRLYQLDLQRACRTQLQKTKEDEKKFILVANNCREENKTLKEKIAELEKKVELCNEIIYCKTRDLLTADRDLHIANEQAANAQRKLEDKLFIASHAKCTSCAVFEKYRDVLTTQIADKTNALSDTTKMLNELKVKLEKQERASQIMSKEIDRMKYDRDAWMSHSTRLETEITSLRSRLNDENVECENQLTPSDTVNGQSTSTRSKDQHVSPAVSSPPSVHSGVGGDKVLIDRTTDETNEPQSTFKDDAPCSSRYIKSGPLTKFEKDFPVRDFSPTAANDRRTENVDVVRERHPWISSSNQKRPFENKAKISDRRSSADIGIVGKRKEVKKTDPEKFLQKIKRITGESMCQKKSLDENKNDGKTGKDDIETRSPLNFYRGPSAFRPKSGFLDKMKGKGLVGGKDGVMPVAQQKKENKDSKGSEEAAEHVLPSPPLPPTRENETRVTKVAAAHQSHIRIRNDSSEREVISKAEDKLDEDLLAAKIKPADGVTHSRSSSIVMIDDLKSESLGRRGEEWIRKQSPTRKRHERSEGPRYVSPPAHHRGHSSRTSPPVRSRSSARSRERDSDHSRRARPRSSWHRNEQPHSPSSRRGSGSPAAQPFIGGIAPAPFTDPLLVGSIMGKEVLDTGAAHFGRPHGLESRRFENPVEIARPSSMHNYTPSSGLSETWQMRQDRMEQSWRSTERNIPSDTWGAKRLCLERDRGEDLDKVRARTESLVMNLARWNGPAVAPNERSISPRPPFRDESSLWRRGQERIFNGPATLPSFSRQEESWLRNREQWNVADERRPSGIASGDRSWYREEHWNQRRNVDDRPMNRHW